jgi:hypothetical protein
MGLAGTPETLLDSSARFPSRQPMNIIAILMVVGALLVCLVLLKLAVALLLPFMGVIGFALAVWALYTCLTSNKPTNTKLLWVIVIVFIPVFGPLLWLLWGRSQP